MARLNIGLRRAKLLCQMPTKERLDFLAEGLPVILESARGFWRASEKLADDNPREADVLEGFAEEEAAKILILIDAVRCPAKLISEKLSVIVSNFYNHLARLIYAEAQGWKPMHVSQLQEYVNSSRQSHYLEGYVGEFIAPNWNLTTRESQLYADIEAYEDGVPQWTKPVSHVSGLPRLTPQALQVAESLSVAGIFTRKGLDATAEIWGQVEFRDSETYADAHRLAQQLLTRLIAENLPSKAATQDDVRVLYGLWQMPMYHIDFTLIAVSLAELLEERETNLAAESYY
jgi:hypothetical protein